MESPTGETRSMTSRGYRVAIVGATGLVGQLAAELLIKRDFPITALYGVASAASAGQPYRVGGDHGVIHDLAHFDFRQVDLAIFSAGGAVSAQYAPRACAAGCTVIDNTSFFRQDPTVPLVVPEVNPASIPKGQPGVLIANPNCSTIQMVVALHPVAVHWGIRGVWIATYQSVSGSGRRGLAALEAEHPGTDLADAAAGVYPVPIQHNVIPHIDTFGELGYTREEMKMRWETQKILGDAAISVHATAVRVPVAYGHSEVIRIQTQRPVAIQAVRAVWEATPGVVVVDTPTPGGYPTPVTHAQGQDQVYIGRIRSDWDDPCAIHAWIVADNTRKGAAYNAVQIAEIWAGVVPWDHYVYRPVAGVEGFPHDTP